MSRLSCLLSAAAFIAVPGLCDAAMLRPFSQITEATVRLADLFDDLGAAPNRVLGAAPAPGARIVVPAAQLAAIARDYDVAWRPASGSEQAIIERRGDVLSRASLAASLRRSLEDSGAPADADIISPDLQPIMVPHGSRITPEIVQLNYEPQGGHFTAMLTVSAADMPPIQMRVAGQVVPMARTAAATHRLSPGSTLSADDVQMVRVRISSLHGARPLQADLIVGMATRHDVSEGQALTSADLTRPPLVQRGALVRMRLDSDGISLCAQGIAVQAGARGDRIRVENPMSHSIVDAEVTSEGEVRVAPRTAAITLVSAR